MPRCTECGNWVSQNYARVMADGETVAGCLECEPNSRRRSGVGHPDKSERGVPTRKAVVEPDDDGGTDDGRMRFTVRHGPATEGEPTREQAELGRWA